MKAAVINNFGDSDVFEIRDIPKPEIRDDELLIKVCASSVNPVDYKQRKGNHRLILGAPFPIVLGYDVAGEVMQTGKYTSLFKKGDRVYGRSNRKYGGALAEYVVAKESVFAKIPDNLSFEHAAAIPLAAQTAYQALKYKAKLNKDQTILINGATGGVGFYAVQIAKIFGAKTYAVAGANHKEIIEKLKPHYYIDYTKESLDEKRYKYNIFFDVAGKTSFIKSKKYLNRNGIYITSLPRPKLIIHKFFALFTSGKKVKTLLMKPEGSELNIFNHWINEGKFKVHIDKTFPLEEISKAHKYCESNSVEGKVVIKINC